MLLPGVKPASGGPGDRGPAGPEIAPGGTGSSEVVCLSTRSVETGCVGMPAAAGCRAANPPRRQEG